MDNLKEAMLYEKLENGRVRCFLCSHGCVIEDGHMGICNVRENRDGVLYTKTYGRTISRAVDPIEKKPLFHVWPGSRSFSIATPGCNLRCDWCQNAEISQMPRQQHFNAGMPAVPADIVHEAQNAGCRTIAYTYTEPTIFFEYSHDTSILAHDAGLANVYVTNGFMSAEMLELYHPYLDAANVDLKAFRDETYRNHVGGRLQAVLDNMKRMKDYGIWLEVTTLLIPGINNDPNEIRDIVRFIANDLGRDTPWHISRFFPTYKMTDIPPTPVAALEEAHDIAAEEGLNYIYLGNVHSKDGENTKCPDCGATVIHRQGFGRIVNDLVDGCCPGCNTSIPGLGMDE